ncbi:hypothetical protein DFS34DRAFT_648093 [Phlyctochytrium arcticum]|nr:hypothetical protein DFS34DRAFT_648093 [Phlyctochytrium arcticum]
MNPSNLQINQLLAIPFAFGGAWSLLAPDHMLRLSTTPHFYPRLPRSVEHQQLTPGKSQHARSAKLLARCFGSQALLCATCLATMAPTRLFYKVFGAAVVPFFLFDYLAVKGGALTVTGGVLDAVMNVMLVGLCWVGWKR